MKVRKTFAFTSALTERFGKWYSWTHRRSLIGSRLLEVDPRMSSPLRGLVALGLLAAALVGLGGAAANASHTLDGQPADRDFVTGESGGEVQNAGTPAGLLVVLDVFDASSGRSGYPLTGTLRFDVDTRFGRSTVATWDVTCLSVAGHQATIGGVAVTNPFPGVLPANALFYVEDGVGGAPDRAVVDPAPTVPPTCPAPPFDETKTIASVTGALTVHDAVELPSNPRQCFGGGWQRYGFENLGKCLVFVVKVRLGEFFQRRLGHVPKFCPPAPPRPT